MTLEAQPDRIADAADVLDTFRHTLRWQSQAWLDDLGIEIHVVTLRAPGELIEDLADQVFQQRRIGEAAPSGGLLVLLEPAGGEARIEVSYSLEHVFPDAFIGRIAEGQLAPYAAYGVAGMAAMDVLHFLKDFAYLRAIEGDFALSPEYRERPGFAEKVRYLSGGAGAGATLAAAELMDRDFKARVPEAKRTRYAPSAEPLASAEAFLRTQREQVGDPSLDLYTEGSRCMLDAYPYAPFEQLDRLRRAEDSLPLKVAVQGDRAVVDSDQPAHGFVPILLERVDGLWRVDLVETWKNLLFDQNGDYWQHNSNHPYVFALDRFGTGKRLRISQWRTGSSSLEDARRALAERGEALDEFLLGELLFRNCWLPRHSLGHYQRASELSPRNLLFHETLGDRASYIGVHDLAMDAYARLGPAGWMALSRAQWAAGDVEAAIATARKALERDPFRTAALDLLRRLLEQQGDHAEAERIERRLSEIRSDPDRPDAAVTVRFHPPRPILHEAAPTQVDGTTVYDYVFFSPTLTNTSAREIEIASVELISDGTGGRSGLGDIVDYWTYPAGAHRLRPGESVSFDKTWGFTVESGHQQLRYVFDVCWKGSGALQCRDYHVDSFPEAVEAAALLDTEARAGRPSGPSTLGAGVEPPPSISSRLELLELLRAREFEELTRRFHAVQAAFEADPSREGLTGQMWDSFASADPTLGTLLDAWAQAVDSYAPHAARGIYHRRSGWAARGMRRASDTSHDQFATMAEHFERAKVHLLRALELHPGLVVAYENLINLGKAGSQEAEVRRLVERSVDICPSCVGPRAEFLAGLAPRWGGSYERMQRFQEALKPDIEAHPGLAVLTGYMAWDRGRAAGDRRDHATALRYYDEALSSGEHWMFRRYRSQVLYRLGRHEEALSDQEAWLTHGLRGAQALMWRAYTLGKLRRNAEAATAIELARRLDPADSEVARLARRLLGAEVAR